MVETTYRKTISTDFGGLFRMSNFQNEVEKSSISQTLRIVVNDDNIDLIFSDTLSEGDSELNLLISNHDSTVQVSYRKIISLSPTSIKIEEESWKRIKIFRYEGDIATGIIRKIDAIGHMDSGVQNFSIKVFDRTNSNILAENTFTDITIDSILNMTPISDFPTNIATIEIFVKKTGGTSGQQAYIEEVSLYS